MFFHDKKRREYPPRRSRAPMLENLEGRELLSHLLAGHHSHARPKHIIQSTHHGNVTPTHAGVIQATQNPSAVPVIPAPIVAPPVPSVPPTDNASSSTPGTSPPPPPPSQAVITPTNLQVSQTSAGASGNLSIVVNGTSAPNEAVLVSSNSDALGSQMSAADANGHFSFTWTNVPPGSYRVNAVGLSSSPSSTNSPPTPDLSFTVSATTPATQANAPVSGMSTTPVSGSYSMTVSGAAPAQAPAISQTGGTPSGAALGLTDSTPYVILHQDMGPLYNITNPGSAPEPLQVHASVDVYSDGTVRVHLDAEDTSSFSLADFNYTVSAHVIIYDSYLDHLLDVTPSVTVGRPYTAETPFDYLGSLFDGVSVTPSSQSTDPTYHVPVVAFPDGPASIFLYVTAQGGLNSASSVQSDPSPGNASQVPVLNF